MIKAPSERPLDRALRLARELSEDPVAASLIRRHVVPTRLIELLELTEEDFHKAFPDLGNPSDGD